MKDKEFQKLLNWARKHKMTKEEKEAQRRSFAFGNASIDNPNVTREMVDQAAERLEKKRSRKWQTPPVGVFS